MSYPKFFIGYPGVECILQVTCSIVYYSLLPPQSFLMLSKVFFALGVLIPRSHGDHGKELKK
ncbi:MAG: hypothetical protein P8078_09625, partial [bacterium]